MKVTKRYFVVNEKIRLSHDFHPRVARALEDFDPGAVVTLLGDRIIVETEKSRVSIPVNSPSGFFIDSNLVMGIIETAVLIVRKIEENNPDARFIATAYKGVPFELAQHSRVNMIALSGIEDRRIIVFTVDGKEREVYFDSILQYFE